MLNNLAINTESVLSVQSVKPHHNKQDTLWEQLTSSQQHSVMSLSQFGYILTNVRAIQNSVFAILKVDNKTATINDKGVIHIKSRIQVNKAYH